MWHDIDEAECEGILKGAIRYLIDGQDLEAARQLLSATVSARFYWDPISEPPAVWTYYLSIFGNRSVCESLMDERRSEHLQPTRALAAQGQKVEVESVNYAPTPPGNPWRAELADAIDEAASRIPGGLPTAARLLASAVRFLIDGGEEDAASMLLSAQLTIWPSGDSWYDGDEVSYAAHIQLEAPRPIYEAMDVETVAGASIRKALEAVLPPKFYIKHFTVTGALVELDPDWRAELLEIARGKGVHNQAHWAKAPRVWNNLNFRSESEVRIARALEGAGLLFFPNCFARLNSPKGRVNREPDFLVCADGKWGILEVDGEPFHPPTRTAEDHERDRLFKAHGIRVVEHFDATECYENAGTLVAKFGQLLAAT
jgi:hypothetical protein